ncbi:HD-GYP domain-containing protein [Desulfosporosinus sp. OT]|uniref:HD-GYP domain-containing protein n=1 Tax=Desulfosporosinus sp. OT TaxID=913865 RepID=UPI001FA7B14F|nr:HD-GYP domain-containing protein [Desulfosporosinus sp. OT]
MRTHLEPLSTNLVIGEPSAIDLFDNQGILLLSKGKPITQNIRELLQRRQLYTLKYDLEKSHAPQKTHKFSNSEYQDIIGYIREIFEDTCLFSVGRLKETYAMVDRIINELERASQVYIDLNEFRIFDNYTYIHSINVAIIAALIGSQMGYNGQILRDLTVGAIFHDIGKSTIPLKILNKPAALTEGEFEIMKSHPVIGEEMLKFSGLPSEALSIVRHHHERWNGKGYPDGLRQRAININAQIVAVADVFDALVADRPYRKGLPPYHALEIIIAGSGKEFNEDIVKSFRQCLILYPQRSVVTLNTGEIGTVIAIHQNYPSRPLIRILFDKYGNYLCDEQFCDLLEDLTRFVQSVDFSYVS